MRKIKKRFKTLFDFIASIILIILFLPIFFIIIIAIKIDNFKHPIFFKQKVMGINAKQFTFVKFRTMVPHKIDYNLRKDNCSKQGEIAFNDSRVTKVGRILRRFKLDEIPQFFSVLTGKMSLIGPRPMDPVRFEHSDEFQKQRLLVKPGITGLAQISGNIKFSWEERIQIDIWYIVNWSNIFYLEILFMTIGIVIFGEKIKERFRKRKITNREFRIKKIRGD